MLPWVYLPNVDWTLTSKRVLTAEWIDGCRVTDKHAIAAMGLKLSDVSQQELNVTLSWCAMVCRWLTK